MISQALDQHAVADALRPVLLRLARELRKETAQFGITGRQATLLGLIGERRGVTASELAAEEAISLPSMTGHLDRLERLELIERVRSQQDRRRVGLSLTPRGTRLRRRIRAHRTMWLAERLGALDEGELARVEAALPALARLIEGAA